MTRLEVVARIAGQCWLEGENIVEDVGGHVEIKHAVIYDDISKESKTIIGEKGSESVKRISFQPPTSGLSSILPFIETKTVWHPKGK